jgi:hypothetical protein
LNSSISTTSDNVNVSVSVGNSKVSASTVAEVNNNLNLLHKKLEEENNRKLGLEVHKAPSIKKVIEDPDSEGNESKESLEEGEILESD